MMPTPRERSHAASAAGSRSSAARSSGRNSREPGISITSASSQVCQTRRRRARDVAHMPVHAAAEERGDVQDCARAHFPDGTVKTSASSAPTMALLAGAAMWGVLWYPYRLLAHAGMDGIWSTIFTYGVTLALGVAIFPRAATGLARAPALTLLMAAAIGWSNLAYVLAVLEGEVMRVLLLFYLAPLWTVPIARVVLRERAGIVDLGVMALALCGAMVMLWKPEIGFPWPRARAEWLGLA